MKYLNRGSHDIIFDQKLRCCAIVVSTLTVVSTLENVVSALTVVPTYNK